MDSAENKNLPPDANDHGKQKLAASVRRRQLMTNLIPLLGLALLVAFFWLLFDVTKTASPAEWRFMTSANWTRIISQFTITCLVAIGAVFAFASGALDMSLSGSVCLSAVSGALAGIATGSAVVMIVVTVAVSVAIALVKGLVAAYLELPVFIVTIVFSSVLSAIALFMMGTTTTVSIRKVLNVPNDTMNVLNVVFVAVYFLVSLYLFNYTKIGKSAKLQGGNPLASGQSGISGKKVIIQSFLLGSVGVALAALVSMMNTKTVTSGTGGSVGTDIVVALVLGGMPLSGGPRSKISAAVVGALIITVLNNGLAMMGLDAGAIQMVRSVMFLVVAFITSITYRTRYLPR